MRRAQKPKILKKSHLTSSWNSLTVAFKTTSPSSTVKPLKEKKNADNKKNKMSSFVLRFLTRPGKKNAFDRRDLLFPKSGAAFGVDFFYGKHCLKVVLVKRLEFGKPNKKICACEVRTRFVLVVVATTKCAKNAIASHQNSARFCHQYRRPTFV